MKLHLINLQLIEITKLIYKNKFLWCTVCQFCFISVDIEQFAAEDSLTNEIHSMSLYSDHSGNMDSVYHGDTIRCYCVFADRDSFGIRTNTLAAYCHANQQVIIVYIDQNCFVG